MRFHRNVCDTSALHIILVIDLKQFIFIGTLSRLLVVKFPLGLRDRGFHMMIMIFRADAGFLDDIRDALFLLC